MLLPEVVEQTQQAINNFAGTGIGLLEISHRSKQFVAVMEEARSLVRSIMQLPDHYEVLFLQGGASLQFCMVPYNILPVNGIASYFDTGTWAKNAIAEAKKLGNVHVACSSVERNYNDIPETYTVATDSAYLHITSNNTIYGTQLHRWPKADCPVVVDMSSDIFSRQVDFSQFDLIYAGVQKNLGPAGATIVVVNKKLLGNTGRDIPNILSYSKHIDKESMFNTPSVLAVYVSWLTLKWIEKTGLENIETVNRNKAELLYQTIDSSQLFYGTVNKKDRSQMNVCFKLKDESLNEAFNAFLGVNGIAGVKGHRSVGGFRASIYNAMPLSGVEKLSQVMREFERTA